MKNVALVLAGGTGQRVGSSTPKQYIRIQDKMIITYCIENLYKCDYIDSILIVCDLKYKPILQKELKQFETKIIDYVSGGESGILSTYEGYKYLFNNFSHDINVVIQDANRCYPTPKLLNAGIRALDTCDSAVAVVPAITEYVVDTDLGQQLLKRESLYEIHRPGFYRMQRLIETFSALERNNFKTAGTSPSTIQMDLGIPIKLLTTDEINKKITFQHDISAFEYFLFKNPK